MLQDWRSIVSLGLYHYRIHFFPVYVKLTGTEHDGARGGVRTIMVTITVHRARL